MRDRLSQLAQAWRQTAQTDPRMPLRVGLAAGGTLAVFIVLGILTHWAVWILGVLAALTVAIIVFGRGVQGAQFSQIEGQPGAAAAVLNVMRGQWFVTPAVAFSKKQDFVHRVIGRCGIVLVGEGSPARVKQLLARERTRLTKLAGGDVPVHTMIVGTREGEIAIDKLQVELNKLKRELSKTEVPKLERRIKSMDRDLPMPKGYIPNPGKKMR